MTTRSLLQLVHPVRSAGFFLLLVALSALSGVVPPMSAVAAEIRGIRFGVNDERTRMVLDLDTSQFEYRRIADGDSVFTLLLPDMQLAEDVSANVPRRGLLGEALISEEGDFGLRVVLRFTEPSRVKTFTLDSNETRPPRLVIDLYPGAESTPVASRESAPADRDEDAGRRKAEADRAAAEKAAAERAAAEEAAAEKAAAEKVASEEAAAERAAAERAAAETAAAETAAAERAAAEKAEADEAAREQAANRPREASRNETAVPQPGAPPTFDPPPSDSRTDAFEPAPRARHAGDAWVVIIDPGHGGEDPGAMGPGLREKDVVLDVSRRLHKLLSVRSDIKPILTRVRDVYLPLRERMEVADAAGADLFVSIHVNAAPVDASGVEVFFLSLGAASDEAARELAKLENEVFEQEVPLEELDELPFSLSLRQSDTLLRSSRAAEVVLDHFVERNLARSRGVKQAGFAVLKSYQTPSVLVELGFVSSAEDREALKSAEHRQRLAEALSSGVQHYLNEFAPTK